MALARIITRSHPCSRELALDLLARGYAVEIVSPDAIPDNIADLELRVDTGPGDQLIASVEAQNGERSASLEFVHHLKAPMVDFRRRSSEPGESLRIPEPTVSFNAGPSIEDVELPAEAPQMVPKTVFSAAEILYDPAFDPEGARPISPLDGLPSPTEPPSYFPVGDSTIARPIARPTMVEPTTVQSMREPQPRDRSVGWRWRAALTFAGVVVLALVLGFGIRRTDNASAPRSGTAPAEKVAAASADVDLLSAAGPEKDPRKDLGQVAAVAVPLPAIKSEGNSGHAPKELHLAKAAPASPSPRAMIPRRHDDDLIARDTVTYLDKRSEQRAFDRHAQKAKAEKRLARRHPSSRKHDGGVIAANKVTYLNKPTPKTAK